MSKPATFHWQAFSLNNHYYLPILMQLTNLTVNFYWRPRTVKGYWTLNFERNWLKLTESCVFPSPVN